MKNNMKDIKNLMLEFISQRQGDPKDNIYPKIQKVLDVKIKEEDDDYGAMGERYIVKCLMLRYANTGTNRNAITPIQEEAICLVDVNEFKKFVNKENAIIWL